jgi:hypothetical protein
MRAAPVHRLADSNPPNIAHNSPRKRLIVCLMTQEDTCGFPCCRKLLLELHRSNQPATKPFGLTPNYDQLPAAV